MEASLQPSFTTLVLSFASMATICLGIEPDPQTGKTEIDLVRSQFGIDMLVLLREKTKNNLTKEEENFLNRMIQDLQALYIQVRNKNEKSRN